MHRKIVSTNDTCSGAPRIEGTRLTCGNIVQLISITQLSFKDFFNIYPYLTTEDIKNCLEYCSGKQCVKDKVISYCHHCTLNLEGSLPPDVFIDSAKKFREFVESPKGQAYLGSIEDYIDEEPIDFWQLAKKALKELNQNQ